MGNYINWTEEEFKAYLCIYAAESNFEYHIDEKKLIESKFSPETINKIKAVSYTHLTLPTILLV